jgi:hypothetical protein
LGGKTRQIFRRIFIKNNIVLRSCEVELCSGLNPGNAINALEAAINMGANKLKEAAVDCVARNANELLGTNDWDRFYKIISAGTFGSYIHPHIWDNFPPLNNFIRVL